MIYCCFGNLDSDPVRVVGSQDECGGDAEHARVGKEGRSQILVNQHQWGVRRPFGAPTGRVILGQCQPHWSVKSSFLTIIFPRDMLVHSSRPLLLVCRVCLFISGGWLIVAGVRSCYDEGKRTAETLSMDYHRGLGIEVCLIYSTLFFYWIFFLVQTMIIIVFLQVRIARIFNTYGPRMCIDDGRVVSNFVAQVFVFSFLYHSVV